MNPDMTPGVTNSPKKSRVIVGAASLATVTAWMLLSGPSGKEAARIAEGNWQKLNGRDSLALTVGRLPGRHDILESHQSQPDPLETAYISK